MISLATAKKLKRAGLQWQPALLDFFAIPNRQMDEKIFVISDMLVTVDVLQGMQVVSFQGASEWALDSLVTRETVWLPREEQLRLALEAALLAAGRPELQFTSGLGGYRCTIQVHDRVLTFDASDASEAYAAALLYLLRRTSAGTGAP
ncbi:MAG: pilus assembly protein CpaE [Chloroflexota bacterium]